MVPWTTVVKDLFRGRAEEGIVEGENLTIEYVNAQADNGTSAMTAKELRK